jgi:FixJ family two-component response regulator
MDLRGEMRLKENDLAEAATILIAVGDGVLADSLRFSLELEGYAVKLCDEYSLPRAFGAGEPQACLVLDQDVFARMTDRRFDALGVPVILMVECRTGRVLARAEAAGVTKVVEKPLLGNVLFDAIKTAMKESPAGGGHRHP